MGADNHATTVPSEGETELITYDADSAHDNYMADLRSDMIRRGVIDPKLGRIVKQ